MKIGLFFGSFNPIHIGHLIIANHVADFHVDQVWFIVSPQNPFKSEFGLLNADIRLHLVKMATEGNPLLSVSDVEFNLPTPSYTINTLRQLSTDNIDNQFSVIMGSDNFLDLPIWKSAEEMLATCNFLVYERPGFKIDLASLLPGIQTINPMLLDISSTKIRDLIKQNKSVRYLVPENVRLLIEEKKYYK